VDGHAVAGQVVAPAHLFGQLEHAAEHGGNPLAVGDAVALDQRQRGLGVKTLHDHGLPAEFEHAQCVAQRRGVVQRRGRQIDGVLVHAHDAGGSQRLGVGLAAQRGGPQGLEHALGPARGTRGIQQVAAQRAVGKVCRRALQGLQRGRQRRRLRRGFVHRPARQRMDGLQFSELGQGLVRYHHQPRAAVLHDVGHLGWRQVGAEHGGIQARLPGRQGQGQDFDTVFQHHRETLACLQPLGMEPLRHLQGAAGHLASGVARTGFGHDQYHPLGSRRRAAEKAPTLHRCAGRSPPRGLLFALGLPGGRKILHVCHLLFLGRPSRRRNPPKSEMPVSQK